MPVAMAPNSAAMNSAEKSRLAMVSKISPKIAFRPSARWAGAARRCLMWLCVPSAETTIATKINAEAIRP